MQRFNLQYLRKSHGLTQRELAELTDYPQGFISQIENGKAPAPEAFISKLQEVFRLTGSDIIAMEATSEHDDAGTADPQTDVCEIVRRFINPKLRAAGSSPVYRSKFGKC